MFLHKIFKSYINKILNIRTIIATNPCNGIVLLFWYN